MGQVTMHLYLIDLGLVLDEFGIWGELERAHGLVSVNGGRSDVTDNRGARVATKGGLGKYKFTMTNLR